MIYLCSISSIDYEKGCADVAFLEKEDMVKTDVPFFDSEYNMPKVGDMVVAIFQENNGKIERGYILGKPYTAANKPPAAVEGLYRKQMGSSSMSCMGDTLTIKAGKIVLDGEVVADGVNVAHHAHMAGDMETSEPI